MSEQNQRNNWPHKISPEISEEMLRVPIPVIAPPVRMDRAAPKDVYGERASAEFYRDTKDAIGVGDKLK
jgi:hypothetical protein